MLEEYLQVLKNIERNLRVLVAATMAADNVGEEELTEALAVLEKMENSG